MKDALIRAARTFLQGFVGVLVLMAVPALQSLVQSAGSGDIAIDLNVWKAIAVAALSGGFISLIAFIQNALEDRTGKALLK